MSAKWSYAVFITGGLLGWWEALAQFEVTPELLPGRWGLLLYAAAAALLIASVKVWGEVALFIEVLNQRWGKGIRSHTEAYFAHERKILWCCRLAGGCFMVVLLPWFLGLLARGVN